MMMAHPEKAMSTPFVEIGSVEALNEFLSKAHSPAITLFKHSSTCGVSSRAYREMSGLQSPVGLVVVQTARSVSDEIERRWSVTHETPQVLIIRDGQVVWDASHFRIKFEDVEAVLRRISG